MINTFKPFVLPILLFSFLFSIPNVAINYVMMPSNIAMWFAAGVMVAISLWRIAKRKSLLLAPSHLYLLAFFVIILFFGTFETNWSSQELFVYYACFASVFIFYIALTQFKFTRRDFDNLLFFIVVMGLFQSLIGIIQSYDDYRLFNLWFGYEPFRIVGRATGTFQQPNMLASFLSLALLAGLVWLYQERNHNVSIISKTVVYFAVALMFFVVFLSGSRAALLAFIVPFFLLVISKRTLLLAKPKKFFIFILMGVMSYAVIWFVAGQESGLNSAYQKLDRIATGNDARIHLYSSAVEMFVQSPWFGYGIGGYKDALHAFYAGKILPEGLSEDEFNRMGHPHNELLYWMLQSGLAALVAVIGFVFFYLKRLFQISDQSIAILVLILPIAIQAMLSYPFGLSAMHLFLLLIFLSFGDKYSFKLGVNGFVKYAAMIFSVLIFSFSVFASIYTFKSIYETHYFYNRMTLYADPANEKYETQGYLLTASKHPLFNSMASEMMEKLYEKALTDNNLYDLNQYYIWCSNNYLELSRTCENAKIIIKDSNYVKSL